MSCKKRKSCSCKFSPDIKIHQDIYSVWGFRKPTVPVLWATWTLESPRLCCGTSDGRVAPGQLGEEKWILQRAWTIAASAVISRMIAGHLGNCWLSLTDKIIWPAAIFVGTRTSSLTPLAVSVGRSRTKVESGEVMRVLWCAAGIISGSNWHDQHSPWRDEGSGWPCWPSVFWWFLEELCFVLKLKCLKWKVKL